MAPDEKLLALWHSRHGNKWSKIASAMPGCCVTSLKNLYYNTARACLRARPVNRGSFLFEYVMLVRDNPDDDAARMAAYEQVCARLGISAPATATAADDPSSDADDAGAVKPPPRRPQQKRVRRKPRRSVAASSSSESGESEESAEEGDESDDASNANSSDGSSDSEQEEEGAPESEEAKSEETEEDETDEDFRVRRRRRRRKCSRAGAGQRARPSNTAAVAATAAAAAPAVADDVAAPRRKLGRQGSGNTSGSSTVTNASGHVAAEAAAGAATDAGAREGEGGAVSGATGAAAAAAAAMQQEQSQRQLLCSHEDVTMAPEEAGEVGPQGTGTAVACAAVGAAATAAAAASETVVPGGSSGPAVRAAAPVGDANERVVVAAVSGGAEPMDHDDMPGAAAEAAEAAAGGLLGSAVAVRPLHMQQVQPQPQPHSCTSSPLPQRFGSHGAPAAGECEGRLGGMGRPESGLPGDGFFGDVNGGGGSGCDGGATHDRNGGPRATGSTSAAHAGPDSHTPDLHNHQGRRALSCDGHTALPMPPSAPGSVTATAAASSAAGMAPPPSAPMASCDALYEQVRDHRQQHHPAKPLDDFFAGHQGPAVGYHGHFASAELCYSRQQQQRLPGAGPSRLQPLQPQPRQQALGSDSHLGQQQLLPQSQSVGRMHLQPFPQPHSAGSSMCRVDTSGTLSTLHSSGDGSSSRVLLCSLPELPGGKRLSLTAATAAPGSLAAAAASPCLLGSPLPGGDGEAEALEGLLHSLERDLGIVSPAHRNPSHSSQVLQLNQRPLQLQLLPHPRSAGSNNNSDSGATQHPLSLSGPHPHPHSQLQRRQQGLSVGAATCTSPQQQQQQARLAPFLSLSAAASLQPMHSNPPGATAGAAGAAPAASARPSWLGDRGPLDVADELLCASGGIGGKSPRRRLLGPASSQPDLDVEAPVARRTDPGIGVRQLHHNAMLGALSGGHTITNTNINNISNNSLLHYGNLQRETSLELQQLGQRGGGGGGGWRGPGSEGLHSGAFEAGPALSQEFPRSSDAFTPRSTADGYAAAPLPFDGQQTAGYDVRSGGRRPCCPVHSSPFAAAASPWGQQDPPLGGPRGGSGGCAAVGPLSTDSGGSPWSGPHSHHAPHHDQHYQHHRQQYHQQHHRHHPHHPHHNHQQQHHHHNHHHHQHQHHQPHCPLHQPHCPLYRHPHALSGAHSMPQPLPSFCRDSWPLQPEGAGAGDFAAERGAMDPTAPMAMQLRPQQQQQQFYCQQLCGGGGGSSRHASGPSVSRLAGARVGPYPRCTLPGPHSPFAAAGGRDAGGFESHHRGGGGGGVGPSYVGLHSGTPEPLPGSHMEWAPQPAAIPFMQQGPQRHQHHQQHHQHHQQHYQHYQHHQHQHSWRASAGPNVQRCYSLQSFEDTGPLRPLVPLPPLPALKPLAPLQPLPQQQQQQQQQPVATDLHTSPTFFDGGGLRREMSIARTFSNLDNSISNGCDSGPGRGISLDAGGRLSIEHGECVTSDTDLDLLVDNLIWNPAPEASWIRAD